MKIPDIKISDFKPFTFTTPGVHGSHSAAQRQAHGCIKKDKKFTGEVCLKKTKTGKCAKKAWDSYCKASDKPCSSIRKTCPVQLVFISGKPHLRFCEKPNQPGHVVPVAGPEQAQAFAEKACQNWKKIKKWPSKFFDRKDILEKSRGLAFLPNMLENDSLTAPLRRGKKRR